MTGSKIVAATALLAALLLGASDPSRGRSKAPMLVAPPANLQQEIASLRALVAKLQAQVDAPQATSLPVEQKNGNYTVKIPGNLQIKVQGDTLLEGNNTNAKATGSVAREIVDDPLAME